MSKSSSKKSSPKLHSYQKVILRPGAFRVPAKKDSPGAYQDDTGRWWRDETFSHERLQRLESNAAKMLESGLKIPAPFAHRDSNKKRVSPIEAGKDGVSLDALTRQPIAWDASINGGFWRDLKYVDDASKINPEFAEGPGLIGTVDTFGDPNDLNTPAGKVSRTVQETSICVLPKYQPPSSEAPIEDFIAHIAMPMHAVEAGQDNFAELQTQEVAAMSEESDDDLFAVSMSDAINETKVPKTEVVEPSQGLQNTAENDDPLLTEVLGLLQQLKIDLPPDTTNDNLVERLNLVLRQKLADQKEMTPANPLSQPPSGSQSKPAPVAMSQESDSAVVKALCNRETKQKKAELKNRVKRLIATSACEMSQAVQDELNAEIDAITMSAEDINAEGDFPIPTVEQKIHLLERTARPMTGSVLDGDDISMSSPAGSQLEPYPQHATGEEDDIPDDYIAGIVNRALPVSA